MGLLVFVTMFQLVDHHQIDRAPPEPTLAFDFTVDEPSERELEVPVTLRDNTSEGERWRQVDYELVATRGRFTLAVNNHFIVRNIGEAQAVASFTIEY